MNKKAFTLIELLITISIIGILAALALPRLWGPSEQSRSTEARNIMGAIRQLEEAYLNGPQGAYLDLNSDGNSNGACEEVGDGNPWLQLGMSDPNANPNSYFTYCVQVTGLLPGQFLIIATRTNIADNGTYTGTQMCLNQNSEWHPSGTNPYTYTPQNPQGITCTSPCCP